MTDPKNDESNRPRSIRLTDTELQAVVKATVHETFVTLGVDASDPFEMQKDFQHLRDWRTISDSVRKKSFVTLVGIIMAGLAAMVWMAVTGKA